MPKEMALEATDLMDRAMDTKTVEKDIAAAVKVIIFLVLYRPIVNGSN